MSTEAPGFEATPQESNAPAPAADASAEPAPAVPAAAGAPEPPPAETSAAEPDAGDVQPNASSVVVFLVNKDLNIIEAQESCLDLFGWKPSELVGEKLEFLLKAGLHGEIGRFLSRPESAQFNNLMFSTRVVARRIKGREFPAEITLRQLPAGPECWWMTAFQELTGTAAEGLFGRGASKQSLNQGKDSGATPDLGPKTILFVEDDPVLLNVYKRRLEREGWHVDSAEDGVAAIEMLPQVRPDLVILDLMLPKLHGFEVLKFIRADVDLKSTPVVVLSNAYMEGLAIKAMQAGANKGMLKTQSTPDKLVDVVRQLLAEAAANGGEVPQLDRAVTPAETAAPPSTGPAPAAARGELVLDAQQEIARIRQDCLAFIRTASSEEGMKHLDNLYKRVRFFSVRAELSGYTKIAGLASVFEALLYEIVFQSPHATPSALQTIAQAVDCLGRLLQNDDLTFAEPRVKPKVLVVDDDVVCNFAIVASLKRANFQGVGTQDPKAALQMMETTTFDLVILDINMPGLNGFEVCERLRRLPQYSKTPVIFVTMFGEFQNRARSILAGGNDLITKPVSPLELTLKVTMRLLNPPEEHASASSAGAPARSTAPAGAPDPIEPETASVPDASPPVDNIQATPETAAFDPPAGDSGSEDPALTPKAGDTDLRATSPENASQEFHI